MPVAIERLSTNEGKGTTIEVRDLRDKFSTVERRSPRGAAALVLLSDPFEHERGLPPVVDGAGVQRPRAARVRATSMTRSIASSAELDDSGNAHARVLDWAGNTRFEADHARLAKRNHDGSSYKTSPVTFELWTFNMSPVGFATKSSSLTEVREWMKVVGGIDAYQHRLRVPPYGDPGEDWLDLNLSARQKSGVQAVHEQHRRPRGHRLR